MKTTQHIEDLFRKYLRNECTLAEIKELLDLFGIEQNEVQLKSAINDYFLSEQSIKTGVQHNAAISEVEANLIKAINTDQPQSKTVKLWPKIVAAAAAVALIVTGAYFFNYNKQGQSITDNLIAQDIAPGKNGATLTLADGTKIFINDALAGNIANQSGVEITKTKDGQIIYDVTDQGTGKIEYNTLTTTRGEQTQVRLPDGSLVFLNAESSLKYPTSFAKSNKRSVGLTGEGYFEISKNKAQPFVVTAAGQQVEVLGTHFNINAYTDEKAVRTTLLEGSVRVAPVSADGAVADNGNGKVLKPGQQSAFTGKGIQVTDVDTDEAMAWQKGYFRFYDEDIATIMRKVSRWYNIEVEYSGELPENGFNARITKYAGINEVLKKLEKTGDVHFKIEGRKVIVSK